MCETDDVAIAVSGREDRGPESDGCHVELLGRHVRGPDLTNEDLKDLLQTPDQLEAELPERAADFGRELILSHEGRSCLQ